MKKRCAKLRTMWCMVKQCPDRYRTQKMCDKVVYRHLFLVDLLQVKSLKYLMMLYSLMLIQLLIKVNNINLNDDHFDDNDLETAIQVKLVAWCNKHKQRKAFTNNLSKKLIIAAWPLTRRWDKTIRQEERNRNIFIDETWYK